MQSSGFIPIGLGWIVSILRCKTEMMNTLSQSTLACCCQRLAQNSAVLQLLRWLLTLVFLGLPDSATVFELVLYVFLRCWEARTVLRRQVVWELDTQRGWGWRRGEEGGKTWNLIPFLLLQTCTSKLTPGTLSCCDYLMKLMKTNVNRQWQVNSKPNALSLC